MDDTVAPHPPAAQRPLVLPLRERASPDPAHGVAGLGEVQVQHGLRERPAQLHQVRERSAVGNALFCWLGKFTRKTENDGRSLMKLCYRKGPFDGWGNVLFFCLNGGGGFSLKFISHTHYYSLCHPLYLASSFRAWPLVRWGTGVPSTQLASLSSPPPPTTP